jgi:toxin secretion/phage lysis holin
MNNVSNLKVAICTTLGVCGSLAAKLFGGWSEDMVTLIIFMAVDYIMGLIVAGVFKNSNKSATGALDSHAGWKGLCKKGVMLAFILVAYRVDILLATDYIRTTAIIGFIANEAISIVENAGLMGVPLPETIKKAIESLKGEIDLDKHNKTSV